MNNSDNLDDLDNLDNRDYLELKPKKFINFKYSNKDKNHLLMIFISYLNLNNNQLYMKSILFN